MKKIISVLIICTMLFATLLAVVPASAADPTKDDLKALIDQCEALDETKYTEVTWENLQKKLADAKKIYDNPTATAILIKMNYQSLDGAIESLIVDTTAIKAVISKAEALAEADYTEESWATFVPVLAQAKEDAKSNDVAIIDAAIAALEASMANDLVALPVDDTAVAELAVLVKLAGILVPSDYSDSAWGMVAMKLEQAAAVAANPTITGYATAIQQLETALNNLTPEKILPIPAVPDVSPLSNIIAYIDAEFTEDMFTAESWAALQAAYAPALELRDAGLKHAELFDQYEDLYKEYTKARDRYIGYAEEIEKAQSRYEEALRDFDKGEATQEDVDAALAVLEDAKAAAVEPKKVRDDAKAAVDAVIGQIIDVARKGEEVKPIYEALNDARETMVLAPKPTDPPATEPVATEPPAETGCGGVIGATAVVITAVLGLGVTVLGKKH